jgi:hypothetical protein
MPRWVRPLLVAALLPACDRPAPKAEPLSPPPEPRVLTAGIEARYGPVPEMNGWGLALDNRTGLSLNFGHVTLAWTEAGQGEKWQGLPRGVWQAGGSINCGQGRWHQRAGLRLIGSGRIYRGDGPGTEEFRVEIPLATPPRGPNDKPPPVLLSAGFTASAEEDGAFFRLRIVNDTGAGLEGVEAYLEWRAPGARSVSKNRIARPEWKAGEAYEQRFNKGAGDFRLTGTARKAGEPAVEVRIDCPLRLP